MNIAEIGDNCRTTKKLPYEANDTFLDFDLLVIDADSIFSGHHYPATYAYKRKDKIKEFIDHKKLPLVIMVPEASRVSLDFNGRRNKVNMHEVLPVLPFSVERELGRNVSVLQSTAFARFFSKYKTLLRYRSYFTEFTGTVLVETVLAKKPVALINEAALFLPMGIKDCDKEDELFQDLVDALKGFKREGEAMSLPAWSQKYLLPTESEKVTEIDSMEKEVEEISARILQVKNDLADIQRNKILFTLHGTALEDQVKLILSAIGFDLLPTNNSREDIVVKYKDAIGIVEVKGVTGSGAEKYAAQLEKWVSEYYEDNGIEPKGILIINPFRDQELSVRDSKVFPDQMLRFSTRKEHCLITTTQLLGIYYDIRNNPEKQNELISRLLETVGVYQEFLDWRKFISEANDPV